MRELLQTLDRRRSYFTITHFAELLRDEAIMIPCDLKVDPNPDLSLKPTFISCSNLCEPFPPCLSDARSLIAIHVLHQGARVMLHVGCRRQRSVRNGFLTVTVQLLRS